MRSILLLLVMFLANPSAGAESPADVFHREYPPAAKRLQEFYTAAEIAATETFSDEGTTDTLDAMYWAAGERAAVEVVYTSNKSNNPGWALGQRRVWVANPDLSFVLATNSERQLYAQDVRRDPVGFRKIVDSIRFHARFACAPWCIFDQTLTESLKTPGLSVVAVTGEPSGGIKISWKHPMEELDRSGWYSLRPDWAIGGYEISMHGHKSPSPVPSKLCCRIEYAEEPQDGIAVIKSVRYWTEKAKDGGKESQVYDFQVTKFWHGEVDPTHFTLERYDLESAPTRRWPAAYKWMITALVVLVVATIGFRYASKRW